MNNSFKNTLKTIIIIGVSVFLLPTLADIIGRNYQERNAMLSFFSNSGVLFQIVGLSFSLLSGIGFLVIKLKEKGAEEILEMADRNDPAWSLSSLEYHTRFIFYKVQSSLKKGTTTELENYTTAEFISWIENIIKQQTGYEENEIEITETRIICCQDYLDNEKDKFVGYIKGNILKQGNEEDPSKNEFSEIYHFVRVENDWLLSSINSSNLWNLLTAVNRFED